MSSTDKDYTEFWDKYWEHGNLTSLPNIFPENYDGSILEFWKKFSANIPDQSKILDIGTGNGAIPAIISGLLQQQDKRFSIIAIDKATIKPRHSLNKELAKQVDYSAIQFISNTPAEETPFPDATFNAVTGQFALEYADVARALQELRRIMIDGAYAGFITHHIDSVVLQTAVDEIEQGRIVLEDADLFIKLRNHLKDRHKLIKKGRTQPNLKHRKRAKELEKSVTLITEAMKHRPNHQILTYARQLVHEMLQKRAGNSLEENVKYIDWFREQTIANVERLQDLVNAAKTADQENMSRILHGLNFEILQYEPIHYRGDHLIGWQLLFKK